MSLPVTHTINSPTSVSLDNLLRRVDALCTEFPFLSALERAFPASEIYLVGGAVRDFLLCRETKDYDFLVRNVSAEALGDFLGRHGTVNWVGKTFGVYKFMPTGAASAAGTVLDEAIDVSLPRTERSFSQSGGYRDFEIHSDPQLPIDVDLLRRDFTINALAMEIRARRLSDPFGGLDDLSAGILRAVGEPRARFMEDTSRLLRGLRLACQFGFQFDPATWSAIQALMEMVDKRREDGSFVVPRETIAKEFIRALVSDPVRAFDLWDDSGAFSFLIPELLAMKGCPQPSAYHTEGDVWTHTRLALAQLQGSKFQAEFEGYDAEVALSVLFHDVGKPPTLKTPERDGADRIRFNGHDKVGAEMTRHIAARLKLSTFPRGSRYAVDEEVLAWLVEKHLVLVQGAVDEMRASTIEKYFLCPSGTKLMQLIFCDGSGTIPPEGVPQLQSYYRLKERLSAMRRMGRTRMEIPPPLLSGKEVMAALKIPPGPAVGAALLQIREEQLCGRLSNRDEAIAFLNAPARHSHHA
jgi:poly(A) polymerase